MHEVYTEKNIMKNNLQFLVLFTLFLSLVACGNSAGNSDLKQNTVSFEEQQPKTNASGQSNSKKINVSTGPRKVIKEGTVSFETNSITITNHTIKKLLSESNGYVAQEKTNSSDYELSQQLTVRIPANRFDHFVNALSAKYSNIQDKNIQVKDVTEAYIDLEARINTKKALKERYLSLLEKANSVNEILSIEKEIAQLQEEIDSFDGKMNYLKDQISWSTLTLSYSQALPQSESDTGIGFGEALENGWDGFVLFLVAIVHAWVFIAIGLIVVFYLLRLRKRKRNG